MKRFKVEQLHNIEGKPMFKGTEAQGEPLLLGEALRILTFSIPPQALTMKDCVEGQRLIGQIAACTDGVLSIEEAEHDWIKGIVETHGPRLFGMNAVVIKEALEDFERANPPQAPEDKPEVKKHK